MKLTFLSNKKDLLVKIDICKYEIGVVTKIGCDSSKKLTFRLKKLDVLERN